MGSCAEYKSESTGDGDGEGGIYRINYRQPKTKKGAISARAAAKIKFINILVKRGFTKTAALAEWRLEEKLPDRCNLRKMLLNPPEKTKRGRKAKGDGGMIVGGMPVAGRARGIRAIKKNPWLTFVKNEGPKPQNPL